MDQHAEPPTDLNTTCPVPLNELARLQALQELGVLDTPTEDTFDSAVRQAAGACNTPIAMISLVDRDRIWAKASTGLHARVLPRDTAFCAHAILEQRLLEVADARTDQIGRAHV